MALTETGSARLVAPGRPVLAAEHITKRYGAVVALADASISLGKGEVLGLVGDNGAGKSTLIKVLSGVVEAGCCLTAPKSSCASRTTRSLPASKPCTRIRRGRHHDRIPEHLPRAGDVGRSVVLAGVQSGQRPRDAHTGQGSWWLISRSRCRPSMRRSRACPAASGKGWRSRGPAVGRRIVILDEPTAALGVQESRQVLDLIQRLKEHDVSVIVVSHNMQQVVEVADRVTVMRLGRTVATRVVDDSIAEEIVGLITGAIPGDNEGA